jgi:hypothetical protein
MKANGRKTRGNLTEALPSSYERMVEQVDPHPPAFLGRVR